MKRKVTAAVGLGLLAIGATRLSCSRLPPSEDPSLIDGRVWVESRPDKHTDMVHAAIFLSDYNFGLFDERSSYAGRYALFDFSRRDGELTGLMLQTNKNFKMQFSVRACDDLPPFDLCLTLSKNPWDGPRKYYGFRDPDAESRELGDRAKALRAQALAAKR